jgi:hypothetical protein
MAAKKKMRVSVDLEGELAAAFLKELGKRVGAGGSPSKADMGRTLIAEGLQQRGHNVKAPEVVWGGFRDPEEGQLAGMAKVPA